MALREDLVIPQGKSWVSPVWALITDIGGPVTLAGRTVKAQVREDSRDAQVLWEWSTVRGNIAVYDEVTATLENEDGTTTEVVTVGIALTVKPSESTLWSWRSGVYDVEVTNLIDPEDVWSIVEPSAVRVVGEVTR